MTLSIIGSIDFLGSPSDKTDLFIGLLFLISSYILFVVMVGKKALSVSDKGFYRGIAISDKILLKERIHLRKYSDFTLINKNKSNLPWLLKFSGWALFSNYHECSVYLIESVSKKRKILISMSEFEMYSEVAKFLKNSTDLLEHSNNDQNNSG